MKTPNAVAAIIPPRTDHPIVCRATAPAPVANTRGDTPKMKANDVIKIGRSRNRTASIVAARISIPRSTRSFANSTIRIEFLAARPISVIRPICAYTLSVRDLFKVSANMAPNAASGTPSRIVKGTVQYKQRYYLLSVPHGSNQKTHTRNLLATPAGLFPVML